MKKGLSFIEKLKAGAADPVRFYSVVSGFTMVIHLMYLIMFFSQGVYIMAGVNIFSVSLYALGIIHILKGKNITDFMQLALIEITIHAVLATLFVGWDFGFQMFLICMLPVPYMLTIKYKNLMHLISITILLAFLVLRLICVDLGLDFSGKISLDPSGWYAFNSFMSFIVIIFVTNNFRNENLELNKTLAEQNADLQKAASTDSLTGLFNRRAMGEPFKIAELSNKGYSIALLDIDYFKKVNDTYGHAAGDMVLTEISKKLIAVCPTEACICRWGGEEILILLNGTELAAAAAIAEKIRSEIAANKFKWNTESFTVTVTVGVAYAPKGSPSEQTVKLADKRLYEGKADGRNRVVSV